MIKVSVLLPVYNAEKFLSACLDSLLVQTFGDFEVIAIDDGSTDGSLGILRAYQARDSRVNVISRENKGLVFTLNQAISAARGEYLARMDADDLSAPDRFLHQVRFLDNNPDCSILGAGARIIDESGKTVGRFRFGSSTLAIEADLYFRSPFCHPAVMFRSSFVRRNMPIYRDVARHAEDLDAWVRLAREGNARNLGDILLAYRRGHGSNVSALHDRAQAQAARTAISTMLGMDRLLRRDIDLLSLRQRERPGEFFVAWTNLCWAIAFKRPGLFIAVASRGLGFYLNAILRRLRLGSGGAAG